MGSSATGPATKYFLATITHRENVAADLWKIRVDPGGDFHFVAGQYATLGVSNGEKILERPYSIVSSPYEKELEFYFELVPQGALTPLLHGLDVGSQLFLRKFAKGRFTLDLQSGHKNHLLLSTVTGVAPFVSFVRTLDLDGRHNKFPADIHLYAINGASRSWELGYQAEMERAAAQASPWLSYLPTVSRPWEDRPWQGERGRVEDVLRKLTDRWGIKSEETTAYLCGHPMMVEHCNGILTRIGFDKNNIREEVYWIPDKAE
ncbi:MAG: FAD-binding oxidoreductase [Candidatus Acidiferrales bacterium]